MRRTAGQSIELIRHALLHGPLTPMEIRTKTGLPKGSVSGALIKSPDLFEKIDYQRVGARWQLTELGRQGRLPTGGKARATDEVQGRILTFLAERGPIWGDDAAMALCLSLSVWWANVHKCAWFTCFARGKIGWVLTPEGRSMFEAR